MRLHLTITLAILASSGLLSNELTNAQTTLQTPAPAGNMMNPLNFFSFNPQDVVELFWKSLKPDYRSDLANNFGNFSAYAAEIASLMFNKNTTDQIFQNEVIKRLMDALDGEVQSIFQGIDLRNASYNQILAQLQNFNQTKLLGAGLRGALFQLESMLPSNSSRRLSKTIENLENDATIVSEITDELHRQGVPAAMTSWMKKSISELDMALRQLVTTRLMSQPTWTGASNLEKLGRIFMNFDYEQFGSVVLRTVDASLPLNLKTQLRDFFIKMERFQPLDVKNAAYQHLPTLYNYTRQMLTSRNISLPVDLPLDLSDLELFGVYDGIEKGLFESMRMIMNDSSSYAMWMDKSVTDLERMAMVLSSVDYEAIGEDISGHLLSLIPQDKQFKLYLQNMFKMTFQAMNLPAVNETLLSSLAESVITALNDTLISQSIVNSNWTILTNSQKLMDVLMAIDYNSLVQRVVVSFLREGESLLSPDLLQNITEVVSMLNIQRGFDLEKKLLDQVKMLEKELNLQIPQWLVPVRTAFIKEVTNQLIGTYEVLLKNGNSPVKGLLGAYNTTFSSLTDFEKLGYVMLSVDYSAIGQAVFDEFDQVLEETVKGFLKGLDSGTVAPYLENAFNMLIQMVDIKGPLLDKLNNLTACCNITQVIAEDISLQLREIYKNYSSLPQWKSGNATTLDKLWSLVRDYNYTSTGHVLFSRFLCVVDKQLPVQFASAIDKFFDAVTNRGDVVEAMDSMRKMMPTVIVAMKDQLKYLPTNWNMTEDMLEDINDQMVLWMTRDALMPFYKAVDGHVKNLTQQDRDELMAVPGRLEKLAKFVMMMDNDTRIDMAVVIVDKVAENMMLKEVAGSMGRNDTILMKDFMDVLESGGMSDFMKESLTKLAGDGMLLKTLVSNTITQHVIQSVADSVTETYKLVRSNAGPGWRTISTGEKSLRILSELDLLKLFDDAMMAAQKGYGYYQAIISPTYTPQCNWDLNNFTYALMNVGKPENRWAIGMVDAWGKPASGVTKGSLKWPGSMTVCTEVKGDRVMVINGSVTVLEKEAIKGEWGMAYIKMPAALSAGLQMGAFSPPIELGICLPLSCEYADAMKFLGRGDLIGLNVTAIKFRSTYPAINGEYKEDSKFIGISAFFMLIVVTTAVCTVVDRLVLLRQQEKMHKESPKMKYELKPLPTSQSEKNEEVLHIGTDKLNGNGSVMYHGAEKVYTNGGFVHDEKPSANGDIEGLEKEHSDVPSKSKPDSKTKPGVGVQLIKAFSLYETMPRLLDSTPKPNQLQALDCIRFLSMTWVIYGHTFAFGVQYSQNVGDLISYGKDGDWSFSAITGGLFAVDSFFLLSGLLVGYLFLKVLKKLKGKIDCMTLTLYYVHRILRLLPLYGGVILIYIAYARYYGTGPFHSWHIDGFPGQNFCLKNWWINLLYINNVYKENEMCNPVSWYLANDMQFYVISPLLLIPLYWVPVLGVVLISLGWGAHVGVTAWLWAKRTGGSQFSDQASFNDIYIKPWCRIGPYLIGLLLAYMLFKKFKIRSGLVQAFWWALSLGIIAVCVYVPYDATKEGGVGTSSWSNWQRAGYESLNKSAWALALGWIIFACNTGCGGFIGDMLNWSGWAPLSRLTFAAYLIHPVIMDLNFKNRHNLLYIDHLSMFFDDVLFVAASYMAGVVLHLLLEAPMLGLEKIILPKRK